MNLLGFFSRRPTASTARERLQILLAHERVSTSHNADLVAKLREEILAVVARHMSVDDDKVLVKMDRRDQVTTLEVDIELPESLTLAKRAVGA